MSVSLSQFGGILLITEQCFQKPVKILPHPRIRVIHTVAGIQGLLQLPAFDLISVKVKDQASEGDIFIAVGAMEDVSEIASVFILLICSLFSFTLLGIYY